MYRIFIQRPLITHSAPPWLLSCSIALQSLLWPFVKVCQLFLRPLALTFDAKKSVAVTIRVWYMFAHSPIIRGIAVGAYITSTLTSAVLAGILLPRVREGIPRLGTVPPRTPIIAWLYVPSLLFHSLLFALKVYRFVTSPKYLQTDTFLWRFLRE